MTDLSQYRPCAGVMLTNAQGLIFAGERLEISDAWQMPQGGIDKGETARDAALRELREETGIDADQVEITGETKDWILYDYPPGVMTGKRMKHRGQKQKWFRMRFLGVESLIDLSGPPQEFSRWKWMSASDLLEAIVDFKRDCYQQVFEELA